jgi:hypothetical protein
VRAPSAAVLALAVALAGCTGDDGGAPEVTSAPAGSFASTADVLAALDARGLPCTAPTAGTYEGVADAMGCVLDEAEDVVLLRFATQAERAGYLATRDDLTSAVVGVDWAVQTVLPQTAQRVAALLGGEVRAGQGADRPAS